MSDKRESLSPSLKSPNSGYFATTLWATTETSFVHSNENEWQLQEMCLPLKNKNMWSRVTKSKLLTIASSFERQKIFAVTSGINWSQFCLRILFWGQTLNCGTTYAVWIFLLFNTYDQTPVLTPTGAIA